MLVQKTHSREASSAVSLWRHHQLTHMLKENAMHMLQCYLNIDTAVRLWFKLICKLNKGNTYAMNAFSL